MKITRHKKVFLLLQISFCGSLIQVLPPLNFNSLHLPKKQPAEQLGFCGQSGEVNPDRWRDF